MSAFLLSLLLVAPALGSQEPTVRSEQRGRSYVLVLSDAGRERDLWTSSTAFQRPRVIPVGDTLVFVWEEEDPGAGPAGVVTTQYLIERAGRRGRALRANYLLSLAYGPTPGEPTVFDPLTDEAPAEPGGMRAPAGPEQLVLVQWWTHSLEEIEAANRALDESVRSVRNLSGQTDIVYVPDAATLDALEQQAYVRKVLPYRPEYRLEPSILQRLRDGKLQRDTYVIELREEGPALKGRILARILDAGGVVETTPPTGSLLRAVLEPDLLQDALTWPEVINVSEHSEPRHYGRDRASSASRATLDNVRADGGANFLESQQIGGAGVVGAVGDESLHPCHPQLPHVHWQGAATKPLGSEHGTSAAGVIFGEGGAQQPLARGVLDGGTLVFTTSRRLVPLRELLTRELVQSFDCLFQSNSWGERPSRRGYESQTANLDHVALNVDILLVQAMGADDVPDRLAWAKNVISVGGITHYGNPKDAAQAPNIGGYEGRKGGIVKPDLCYWHDQIWTTSVDAVGKATHGTFSGTSASTPQVAGYAGLVYAMWHAGLFKNVPGVSPFKSAPRPSVVRALLVNSAQTYALDHIHRYQQGWGRPDLETLHERRDACFVVDESVALRDGHWAAWEGELHALATTGAGLRVTLVYRDAPSAAPDGDPSAVNDLSLRVLPPAGDGDARPVYWGNVGLVRESAWGTDGEWSQAGGLSDLRNTVENVFLSPGTVVALGAQAGLWRVEVLADRLNQDILPGGARDAHFALVITGLKDPVRVAQ